MWNVWWVWSNLWYIGDIKSSGLDVSKVPVRQILVGQIYPKGVPMKKVLKTSAEGRICKYPNCQQVLSIYNHQLYCRVHQEKILSEQKLMPYKHFGK